MGRETTSPKLLAAAWLLAGFSLLLTVASLGGNGDGLPGLPGTAGLVVLTVVLILVGLFWGVLASRAGREPTRGAPTGYQR